MGICREAKTQRVVRTIPVDAAVTGPGRRSPSTRGRADLRRRPRAGRVDRLSEGGDYGRVVDALPTKPLIGEKGPIMSRLVLSLESPEDA